MTGLVLVAILFGVVGTLYGYLAYRAVRSERRQRQEEIAAIAEVLKVTIRRKGDGRGRRRHLRALPPLAAALAAGGEWLRRHEGDYRPLVLTGALVVAAAALIVGLNTRPPGIPGRALPPALTGTSSTTSSPTVPTTPTPGAPRTEGPVAGPVTPTPARLAPPGGSPPQPPGEPTGAPTAAPTTPPTAPVGRSCLIELSVDAVGLDLCVVPPRTPALLLRL